jgi:site-specific DNA-adenine methylase
MVRTQKTRQLKPGNNIKLGIPYQGSKTKIIDQIARFFPNADHFYDLFGGGFSASHYMIVNRKKSYKHFHYNEIRPGLCELIRDSIDGKYNYDVFKPEWVSREKFMAEKESNAYIKILWSFGNNGETYLFGKDIESEKRSMHMAVVFDEFDDFIRDTFKLDAWPNSLDITGKRLFLKMQSRKLKRFDLRQLQQLERLQQLELTNKSYEQVEIKPNSVIYCDIPYQGTADYGDTFNNSKFFDWASAQENPVFVSEYKINDDRFFLLKEFTHRTVFSAGGYTPVVERLYGNKIAYEIIQKARAIKQPTRRI